VRGALAAAFGERALAGIMRLRAEGSVGAALADELRAMETLFLGAYAASSADLGLPPDGDPEAAAALPGFLAWRGAIGMDPDLSVDARMMVPLFHDVERDKIKVLAFLGWTRRPISASFSTPPRVEVGEPEVVVAFKDQCDQLVHPVVVELYVSTILDRAEMRALCAAKKTRSQIVAALSS
jgi:hypothetical protein